MILRIAARAFSLQASRSRIFCGEWLTVVDPGWDWHPTLD